MDLRSSISKQIYPLHITPVENRICSNCNSKSVEDELHFLMYCPKFENHRRELFSYVLNDNAAIFIKVDKDYEIVHERRMTS
jgi:phosphoheptose isomerase